MRKVLGLNFSTASLTELAQTIVDVDIPAGEGPRVVATANVDHIVNLADNEPFRQAYAHAWVVTADGMPVYAYSRLRGAALPSRVTGSDLCDLVLENLVPGKHRCFFVASSLETTERLKSSLLQRGFAPDALAFVVPPFGFDSDQDYSRSLATLIAQHGTTHLMFGVGSPKSEVWTDRFRDELGDCYVLNVGAGLDFFAGTKARAPVAVQQAGFEWAWRFALEPRRLFRRYFVTSWRFFWLVGLDVIGTQRGSRVADTVHPRFEPKAPVAKRGERVS